MEEYRVAPSSTRELGPQSHSGVRGKCLAPWLRGDLPQQHWEGMRARLPTCRLHGCVVESKAHTLEGRAVLPG